MRSIPHRVVCLLGLDDGGFPRHIERDGDDLTARDPRVGDRDARSEDRQLLLDALLAAAGHLIITYSGRDERSNQRRPPAVPVGELLDVVDRTVSTAEGTGQRGHRDRAPAAAFRPAQLRTGQARALPGRGASTRSIWKGPAPPSPGAAAPAVPRTPPGTPLRRARSSSSSWTASSAIPSGSSCANARRLALGPDPGVRGRHSDRARRVGPVGDRRAYPAGAPGRGRAGCMRKAEGPGGRCRPGRWPTRCSTRSPRRRRARGRGPARRRPRSRSMSTSTWPRAPSSARWPECGATSCTR